MHPELIKSSHSPSPSLSLRVGSPNQEQLLTRVDTQSSSQKYPTYPTSAFEQQSKTSSPISSVKAIYSQIPVQPLSNCASPCSSGLTLQQEREIDKLTAYLPPVAAIGIRNKLRKKYIEASSNTSNDLPVKDPKTLKIQRAYSADNLSQGTPTPRPDDINEKASQLQSQIKNYKKQSAHNTLYLTYGTIGTSYLAYIVAKSTPFAQSQANRGLFGSQESRLGGVMPLISTILPTLCTMATGATVCHLLRNYFCYQQDVIIAGIIQDLKNLKTTISNLEALEAATKESNQQISAKLETQIMPVLQSVQQQTAKLVKKSRSQLGSESPDEDYGSIEKDLDLEKMIRQAEQDVATLQTNKDLFSSARSFFGYKKKK